MSKSAPKPPTPIDPTKVSNAQEGASIGSAVAQNALNNGNVTNPYGTTTHQQTGTTMVDGHAVPTYSTTSTLNPLLQSLLNSQEGSANTAAGNLNLGPLNFSGLPSVGDPNLIDQNTVNAEYNQATSRLDPQWQQSGEQMSQQLANQGIPLGSAAYDRAMQNFNLAKNDAYTSAQNSATESGVRDASQLYQDSIAGRQQGINEQVTGQNQPLSVLSQILSGITGSGSLSPSTQTSPVSVETPNVLGAYGLQEDQQNKNYAAATNQYAANMGGLGSLFGNALTAAMMFA